jgi:hypothetical protein
MKRMGHAVAYGGGKRPGVAKRPRVANRNVVGTGVSLSTSPPFRHSVAALSS